MTYPYNAQGVPIERLPSLMILIAEAAVFIMALLIALAIAKAIAIWIDKQRIHREWHRFRQEYYEQQMRERHK